MQRVFLQRRMDETQEEFEERWRVYLEKLEEDQRKLMVGRQVIKDKTNG